MIDALHLLLFLHIAGAIIAFGFGFTVPEAAQVTLDPAEHTAQVWLPWQQAMEKTFSPTNRDAIWQLSQRRRS